MKKNIFFSLFLIVILAISSNVFAAENYGEVKDITKQAGDSLTSGKGTMETKGNTTTIRYSAATFKMLDEDADASDGTRPGPAAWIGFEITEPTDDRDSKFKVTLPDNQVTEIKASYYRDYVGITPDNLKKVLLNGTVLTYQYAFDWNEDGSPQQYVIIQIDPKEITLLSTNGETVWSPEIAQDILNQQNPDTSDVNIFFYIILMFISGIGFLYYFKKA